MKKIYLLCIFSLCSIAFAQKTTKEFLGKDRKQCDSSVAIYYRVINYDNAGKPSGMVKQFYVNGEPEWEGQFFNYNKNNPEDNSYQGQCTWFYPNGKKKKTAYYQNGTINGPTSGWYDNGNLKYQFTYRMGIVDGLFLQWYDNGLLKNYAVLDDGYVVGTQSIYCNKYGECTSQDMYKFKIPSTFKKKWYYDYTMASILGDDDKSYYSSGSDYRLDSYADVKGFNEKKDSMGFSTHLNEKQGLLVKAGPKGGCKIYFKALDYAKFFRIDLDLVHKNKKSKKKSGLVFAYRDAKNYEFFIIDPQGNYQIGSIIAGEKNIVTEGSITSSNYNYNFGYKSKGGNSADLYEISVSHYKDTLKYLGKNTVIYKRAATDLQGDYLGFFVDDKEAIQVSELNIKTEINSPFVSADIDSKEIEKPWRSSGSGFMVSTEGYIVTNYHVVDDATEIEADVIRDGSWISYRCEVMITDEKSDLAVLKVTDSTFKKYEYIPFILQTNLASVGSNVYALGYPYAMSTLGNELKFTEGTINARSGFKGELLAYQISVPVQPGNSGGPLFDLDGNVIGVVNSKLVNADNVAFAVKANYIINLLQMLPSEIHVGKKSMLVGKSPADQVSILKQYVPLIKVR